MFRTYSELHFPRALARHSTGVLNQFPFIRCRIPTWQTFALMSVCVRLRAWLHIWMLAMDWSVPNLQCFVHLVLSVVILLKCVCRVKLERELASERFPGEEKKGACSTFFSLNSVLYCTDKKQRSTCVVLSFPVRPLYSANGTFFFSYTPSYTWSVTPWGEWDQIRHLPCSLSCSACASGCHAPTFGLLSQ